MQPAEKQVMVAKLQAGHRRFLLCQGMVEAAN